MKTTSKTTTAPTTAQWYPVRPTHISRRTVLRGAGGVAVGLPFLETMLPRKAEAAGTRKYFLPVFTPNGIIPQFWASGTETDFTLGKILEPIAAHKNDVIVLHGIKKEGGTRGDNHETGINAFLTGRELNAGTAFSVGGSTQTVGWGSGISLDQFLGAEIAKTVTTKFKTLDIAVVNNNNGVWGRMIYAGSDKPVTPESSPYALFNRLFSDLDANKVELDKLRVRRKSILDTVLGQFTAIGAKVSAADKAKLDAHATSIRDIEQRLSVVGGGVQCTKPTMGATLDFMANDNYPVMGTLQMDLIVMALACDLTRVASLMWNSSTSGIRFTWLGITEGHHDISHLQSTSKWNDTYSATPDNEKLLKISIWYTQQFNYLMNKLKGVPDGTGTLLDNAVVLWGNEISNGPHDLDNLPYVLAGGGWGTKMGRYLNYDRTTKLHNNLLVSAMNAMGVPGISFGNPAWVTGAGVLPRLKA